MKPWQMSASCPLRKTRREEKFPPQRRRGAEDAEEYANSHCLCDLCVLCASAVKAFWASAMDSKRKIASVSFQRSSKRCSRPAVGATGWRRRLRSPAHARGQPPWVSQRCLVKTRVPPRRHRHREWGLRPQAPPPPCGQHRAPLRKRTAMVPGWAVWACGRRTHSRSRHGPGASEVLTRRCCRTPSRRCEGGTVANGQKATLQRPSSFHAPRVARSAVEQLT